MIITLKKNAPQGEIDKLHKQFEDRGLQVSIIQGENWNVWGLVGDTTRLDERLIHAVGSHGYGLCSDVKPEHEMEKVLFATDELTGLIGAAIKMRPSKSTKDLELSSLKKKFKDKKFAAGCSRDVIRTGAEMLGWELDKLMSETIEAMRASEDDVIAQMESL